MCPGEPRHMPAMTQEQLDSYVDARITAAAPQIADQAVEAFRRAAPPAPEDRPGGSGVGANVNLNRAYPFSLVRTINALRNGSWTGSELERDVTQAAGPVLNLLPEREAKDKSQSVFLPTTALAFRRVTMAAGINSDFPAMRAANEGSTAAGGALVPPEYLQDQYTLSLQGPVAFVNAPGVTDLPVKSNSVFFPRETVMPTSGAYAEAATITESDPTFGQQNIIIKKQAVLNQFSNELLADAIPEYEQEIAKSIVRSLTLYQDSQYLEGTGAGAQITGLGSYSGLTAGYTPGTNGDSASAAGYLSKLIDLVFTARAAGWEPNAWIAHPRFIQSVSKVVDSNGRYILESVGGVFGAPVAVPNVGALPTQATYQLPPWRALLLGIPVLMSNQIPINETQGTGTTCTHVYLGDFNFARRLVRQAIELAISEHIYFTTDQTAVRATGRSALVLLQPAAFIKQSGILA